MSNRFKIEDVTLIYGSDAERYSQPLADVPEVGTLIDPEDGEDLDLYAVEIANPDLGEMPIFLTADDAMGVVTLVWIDDGGVQYFQDVTDIVEEGAAISDDGEDLELSHVLLVEC